MKILTDLKYTLVESPESPGMVQRITITNMSDKGIVRHIQLTNSHLLFRKKDAIVAIRLNDIIQIAEKEEPRLTAGPSIQKNGSPPIPAQS